MRPCRFFIALFMLLAVIASAKAHAHTPAPSASGVTPNEALRAAVLQFIEQEARSFGPAVRITLPPRALPANARPCAAPEVFLPQGSRAWGRFSVGLRCRTPAWVLFVPARVEVFGDYLSAARPLAVGTVLASTDLKSTQGDLASQPPGTLTALSQAVGRSLRLPMLAGATLTANHLLNALTVQRGQTVRVVAQGEGFAVANEGIALGNAAEGQLVQVRLSSGRVIQGIARQAGVVEVVN